MANIVYFGKINIDYNAYFSLLELFQPLKNTLTKEIKYLCRLNKKIFKAIYWNIYKGVI